MEEDKETTEESVLLQRIDPDARAYRWYKITLCPKPADSLLPLPKVIIVRGRIGQTPETIERHFDRLSEAKTYFTKKVKQRFSHGYIKVDKIEPLFDSRCALCNLIKRSHDEAGFIHDFEHSILLLNWDQTYLGRSILLFKKHIPDFFRLAPSELLASLSEIRQAEEALRKAFAPRLMNYLFMGNQAGHVHLHLVPRYESDPNFGNSPFLETSRTVGPQLPESCYQELAEKVRKQFRGGRCLSDYGFKVV